MCLLFVCVGIYYLIKNMLLEYDNEPLSTRCRRNCYKLVKYSVLTLVCGFTTVVGIFVGLSTCIIVFKPPNLRIELLPV